MKKLKKHATRYCNAMDKRFQQTWQGAGIYTKGVRAGDQAWVAGTGGNKLEMTGTSVTRQNMLETGSDGKWA